MKRTAMQHTKLKRLVRVLQVPQYAAVGILESLWHLTAREAPMGNIGKLSNEDIAAWIDWTGDADSLMSALVSSGWVDSSETDRLVIHDWFEHADDATKLAIKRKTATVSGSVGQTPTTSDKTPLPLPLPLPLPEPVPSTKAKATTGASAPFALPDWIETKVWDGYEEMRKKIRKPMTDNARDLCVKKLASLKRAGHDPTDVLNEAILNSWQGIFAPKGVANGNARITNDALINERADYLREREARRMASEPDYQGGHVEAR